jgi:hypothetical protein
MAAEEVRDGGHDHRHGLRRGCGEDGRHEGGRVDLPRHLAVVGVGFSGDFGDGGDKRARPGQRPVGDVAFGASASDSAGRSTVALYSPTRATDMPPTTANRGATHVHLAADGRGPLGFLFF